MVAREVEQVRTHRGAHSRVEVRAVRLPERALRAIAGDQFALAVQHQRGEAAACIRLGRAHQQQRRLDVHGLPLGIGAVRRGRVLVALLLEVQIAERRIESRFVCRRTTAFERFLQGVDAVGAREPDAERARRVVHQLRFRPRQCVRGPQAAVVDEQPIEQAEKRRRSLGFAGLLEQRPAMLVERLHRELRIGAATEHRRVGLLRVVVPLRAEEDLAAPELRLFEVLATGVVLHESIEGAERLVWFADAVPGPGKLVKHDAVRRVLGVFREQPLVGLDCFTPDCDGAGGALVLCAQGVGCSEAQIAQSPQRLCPHSRVCTLDLQKLAIGVGRELGVRRHRFGLRDLDTAFPELGQRRRLLDLFLRERRRRAERQARDDRDQDASPHGLLLAVALS